VVLPRDFRKRNFHVHDPRERALDFHIKAGQDRNAAGSAARTNAPNSQNVVVTRCLRRVNRREKPLYRLLIIIVVPASMASVSEMKPHARSEVDGHAAPRVIIVAPRSITASLAKVKPHVRCEVHG